MPSGRADLRDLAHVGDERVLTRGRRVTRGARELELPARLDRDPLPVPFEPDDVLVLARGGETTPLQARQHRLDSVPALVGDRRPVRPGPDLLLLEADAELRARFRPDSKVIDQILDGQRHGPRRLMAASGSVNVRAARSPSRHLSESPPDPPRFGRFLASPGILARASPDVCDDPAV